jgi:Cu-Zn family superoxide dismutase
MRVTRPLAWSTAAVTAALVFSLAVPAAAAPVRGSYLLKPLGAAADAIFPEGVATDGDFYYVGSTTDGTIYRGDLDRRVATPYLPGGEDGRTSAIGLKVDDGNLFVAGGATGRFFVYDTDTGELVGSYQVDPAPSSTNQTFLNDAAVAPDGSVYVTDSIRSVLYRIGPDYATDGVEPLPVFLDFTGTALEYTSGFNVNGIAVTPDGRYLVLAKSNSRELYRVDLQTQEVSRIDLGGAPVAGDGLVLVGSTLYAVERQGDVGYIVEVALSGDLSSGTVVGRTTDKSFDDPTTAALDGDRLLVVNSQFGERSAGERPGPFTVSSIPLP